MQAVERHEIDWQQGILETLELVTKQMGVAVSRCSDDLRYLWANQEYANWIQRPLNEIVGRPIVDVLGKEAFEGLLPHFRRVLTGERVDYEREANFQGIGRRWTSATYTPTLDANGVANGWVAVVLDITERKLAEEVLRRSEERFRLAAHVGKMFAYEWDADTDVFKVLGEIPEIFGIKKEEYATGKLMLAKMHPDDRQRLMAEVAGICPEKPQFRIRIRLTRSDGTLIWVEKNGYWVFNEQGRLLRIVGMVIDITESKQSEEIVASVGGRLIEAQEEERRRIARELHDDVSQKLAMLTVGLEELARISPESQTQARNRIGSLLKSAAEMTNDVHALSHRLHTSRLELVGLVGTMKSFCREFAEQRYVEIDFTHSDVPSSLPSQVSLCLYRIMQEGLANAVKHSGVRHFDVRLERVADALQLTIRDPGVGFDPSTTMDYQGLGLISMRERVNLVKGTLSIESKPGEGTQIQVRVPIAAQTGGDQKSASA